MIIWIKNNINISGDRSEIERFIKETKGLPPFRDSKVFKDEKYISDEDNKIKEYFCFNKIIPVPHKNYGFDWCLQNWGVRWDIWWFRIDLEDMYMNQNNGTHLNFSFLTPNTIPIEIFKKLAELYPRLSIQNSFYELRLHFAGEIDSHDGIFNMTEYTGDELIRLQYEHNIRRHRKSRRRSNNYGKR